MTYRLFFASILAIALLPGFVGGQVAHAKAIDTPADITKDEVGLNVHWALGGVGADDLFEQRLNDSRTIWAREHFYYEVLMGPEQEAWLARYDKTIEQYEKLHIHVVGMLAYGPTHNDFRRPPDADWQRFVDLVSARYGKYVQVWEVWNEPDSKDFLNPSDPWNFKQLMSVGYDTIKSRYPGAVVLNGGLASPNPGFAEVMLRDYGNKFDAVNIHLYQCGYYFQDGDFRKLDSQMDQLKTLVDKYKPGAQVWVTEFGCSNFTPGVQVTEQMQSDYVQKGIFHLLHKGWIERVFIYTIRNRDIKNPYEDHFGLLNLDMSPRLAWNFYAGIPEGPYGKRRESVEREAAHAEALRAELEPLIEGGFVTINKSMWPTLVSASLYGGYPLEAILAASASGGKTVHPTIPHGAWKQSDVYKEHVQVGIELRNKVVLPAPPVVATETSAAVLDTTPISAKPVLGVVVRPGDTPAIEANQLQSESHEQQLAKVHRLSLLEEIDDGGGKTSKSDELIEEIKQKTIGMFAPFMDMIR